MNQKRAKGMTESKHDQLYQNNVSLHTAETTFPYSAVFYNLPPGTFTPSNSMPFQTQSCFPEFWICQQALGRYFNWIRPKHTNCENQPSLIRHEIFEINRKRPSVIQSTGRVPPLDEAGTNTPLTNVLSRPSKTLDVDHNISNHKESDSKTAMLKEKQLSSQSSVHKVCENQNILGPEQVTSEATKISVLDAPEEKSYRFYCRFCNKPYHWRSHWTAHERIHTGERPFKCEICGKTFTRSDGLQCHRYTHLRKNDSTSSMSKREEYIQNNILTKDKLRNDDNDKLSERVKVKNEGKEHFKNRFNNKVNVSKAKKYYHCHLCRKSFFSSNGLQHHLRQHSNSLKTVTKESKMLKF